MNREKIIKGLECCTFILGKRKCNECPYQKELPDNGCYQLQDDFHVLLKEQEAVEPILKQDSMVCGVCGHEVIWQKMLGDGIWADEELNYCPHCGRAVKWE